MKIVYINETCGSGSIGKLTLDLADGLQSLGYTTYIFYSKSNTRSFNNTIKIGNKVFRNIHAICSRITGLQGYFSILSTLRLLRQLNRIAPDIVHLQNLHANYINLGLLFNYLKRKRIVAVITLHDSWYYTGKCTYYVPAKCDKWMKYCGTCPLLHKDNVNATLFFDTTKKCLQDKKKWLLGIEHLAVVGVSKWVTDEAKKSFLKDKKPITIKNWVDQTVFRPKNAQYLRDKLRLNDRFIVLMVSSRISTIKGYDILLGMARKLENDVQIVVIGKNSDNLELPSNIIHVPYTSNQEELADYYSLADVCVNTTKYETFGMVTAEALSCATPVIVFDNTASPELCNEGCGYVVDEKSGIEGIIDCIHRVKRDGKGMYSEKCHIIAQSLFSKVVGIHEYEKLYRKIAVK